MQTALNVCKAYKDPETLWMEQTAAARQKLRRACEAQGWDEDATEQVARMLTEQRYNQGVDTLYGCKAHYAEVGGLCYYLLRFFYHLNQICTQDQLVPLIHEGELIHKLRGSCVPVGGGMVYGTESIVEALTQVWTVKSGARAQQGDVQPD